MPVLLLLACSASENRFVVHDAPFLEGEVLVGLKEGEDHERDVQRLLDRHGWEVIEELPELGVVRLDIGTTSVEAAVAELARERVLDFAEPNYVGEALAIPDDTWFSSQWGLAEVRASEAWDLGGQGSGVKVAVLDTGTWDGGADGFAKMGTGYDAVYGGDPTRDVQGHGTHVAGTIAQTTNNAYGVAGLAPGVEILPVKVLGDSGSGSYADIAEGISWSADHGASVLNMSLGGGGGSYAIENAVKHANSKGALVIAASGNEGTRGSLSFPAELSTVMAVGSTDKGGGVSSFSNEGPALDITAPGRDILQETPWGWGSWSGTSMATPHVAAAAALVYAQGITDPDEVREILDTTAEDKGSVGHDESWGYGILDAAAAVREAQARAGGDTGWDTGGGGGDTRPPTISNLWIDKEPSRIVLHWKTDEPATSDVEFDPWGMYAEPAMDTKHVRPFDMSCGYRYTLRIHSTDAAGNTASTDWSSVYVEC